MRSEHRAPFVASIVVVLACIGVMAHAVRTDALGGIARRTADGVHRRRDAAAQAGGRRRGAAAAAAAPAGPEAAERRPAPADQPAKPQTPREARARATDQRQRSGRRSGHTESATPPRSPSQTPRPSRRSRADADARARGADAAGHADARLHARPDARHVPPRRCRPTPAPTPTQPGRGRRLGTRPRDSGLAHGSNAVGDSPTAEHRLRAHPVDRPTGPRLRVRRRHRRPRRRRPVGRRPAATAATAGGAEPSGAASRPRSVLGDGGQLGVDRELGGVLDRREDQVADDLAGLRRSSAASSAAATRACGPRISTRDSSARIETLACRLRAADADQRGGDGVEGGRVGRGGRAELGDGRPGGAVDRAPSCHHDQTSSVT